jgi:hypothetical protein
MRPYFTAFQSDRESVDPPNIISHLLVVQPGEKGVERGKGNREKDRIEGVREG